MPHTPHAAKYVLRHLQRELKVMEAEIERSAEQWQLVNRCWIPPFVPGEDHPLAELYADHKAVASRIATLRAQTVCLGGRVLIQSDNSDVHHRAGVIEDRTDRGATVSVCVEEERQTFFLPWNELLPYSKRDADNFHAVDRALVAVNAAAQTALEEGYE